MWCKCCLSCHMNMAKVLTLNSAFIWRWSVASFFFFLVVMMLMQRRRNTFFSSSPLSTPCSNHHCKSHLLYPWTSCAQPEIVLSSAPFTASTCPDWNQILHPVMRLPDVLSLAQCTCSYPVLRKTGCEMSEQEILRWILNTVFLWTFHVFLWATQSSEGINFPKQLSGNRYPQCARGHHRTCC